jgi:phosphate starvation-inducible protein PhoH and related proteins
MVRQTVLLRGRDEAELVQGPNDMNLKLVKQAFGVSATSRKEAVTVSGDEAGVTRACRVLEELKSRGELGSPVTLNDVEGLITAVRNDLDLRAVDRIEVFRKAQPIVPRTQGQERYVAAMRRADIVFSIGPAGSGKTYLAVAMATAALRRGDVRRIVLVRPAVEAGEKLGFLPGDMQDKVNPYLRPLYDALNDMMDFDQVKQFCDRGIIEVAPLAFMRGRTLNHSFIIMDEAQNCTVSQMKMFLTRLGASSQAVLTGDVTQTDLAPNELSGLRHAWEVLRGIEGIRFVELTGSDIVRHRLVQEIVDAYGRAAKDVGNAQHGGVE